MHAIDHVAGRRARKTAQGGRAGFAGQISGAHVGGRAISFDERGRTFPLRAFLCQDLYRIGGLGGLEWNRRRFRRTFHGHLGQRERRGRDGFLGSWQMTGQGEDIQQRRQPLAVCNQGLFPERCFLAGALLCARWAMSGMRQIVASLDVTSGCPRCHCEHWDVGMQRGDPARGQSSSRLRRSSAGACG